MLLCITLAMLCFTAPLVKAGQKCQADSHGVRRYNGHPCASTTHYDDGHRGACGCGPSGGDTPFDWNLSELVVAPNGKYFDNGGSKDWCGHNCGKCVELTPTGGFIDGQGQAPTSHSPHIFMVTNDCPANGNQYWCGQAGKPGTNHVSRNGYEVHFDLQNRQGQASHLGWDNPEVTWKEVNCPSHFQNLWNQCECHSQGK